MHSLQNAENPTCWQICGTHPPKSTRATSSYLRSLQGFFYQRNDKTLCMPSLELTAPFCYTSFIGASPLSAPPMHAIFCELTQPRALPLPRSSKGPRAFPP